MKKIAILTSRKQETTTEYVMDWLEKFGVDIYRINAEDFDNENICINDSFSISDNNNLIKIEYDALWFRRWKENESYSSFISDYDNELDSELFFKITSSIKNDYNILQKATLSSFKAKYIFSNLNQLSVNKIKVLDVAVEVGLKVPSTLITGNKEILEKFAKEHINGIIVKDLDYPFYVYKDNKVHCIYVSTVDDITKLPDNFPLSYFQEKVEKKIEIRTFFLNGECFSMAIFSQEDDQTSVDFRRYNHLVPNRTVPYKLPLDIESKINDLMSKLKLETGSIDMIKNKKSEFIFLEVNPVGQFGMTSYPCNYNLEKKVAEHLYNSTNGQ